MNNESQIPISNSPNPNSQITIETALWILVALVALALRLSHLDAAPLNEHEAREAMLAWRAVTGQGMPQGDYSPLFFVLNALLFTLCGSSDAIARLWPALLGSALPLAPLLFRRRIGRVSALAAGLYLTFSPTALVAARQLDGAGVAVLGGLLFLGGLVSFVDTHNHSWLTLSAVGLALAVTSSPSAYGLLLTLVLAWLILTWLQPDHALHLPFDASRFFLTFSIAALAFSTGLGWNPAGLGATGDLLLAWVTRFGAALNPAASPLTILTVYEPLVLTFGLGGLAWVIRREHRLGALLGLWAGLGVLLLSLTPGRTPLDTLWIILPLAMLAGVAVESLARSLRERGDWFSEGIYIPVMLVLWVHAYLVLTRYAARGEQTDLFLFLLVLALQVLLGTMFALAMRPVAALRAAAVSIGVVLLAVTLSAGWGVARVRPADPRETLLRAPTAIEVRDLVQTLRELSWRETGMATTLPLVFEAAPDSVLAWYLRDFSAARRVESLAAEETGLVLVTSRRDLALSADGEYAGQDFVLRRSWDPAGTRCIWGWPPRCNAAVGWLLRRRSPAPPVAERWAVLWLESGVGSRD
ncbi:MAG: hypothetical protein DRJ03_20220 [Chloroflexi bacterium]|nr:MAG: hypothetical protein DRJ03_20220 [Chloroflexota bacterium]